ncbi:MAG: CYTH domain-containing protein [Pseudolabrys sp.]|jgi:adenylate cyclase
MAVEIERRFLVTGDGWKAEVARHIDIRQAYLAVTNNSTVRVRIHDGTALLTIKSAASGLSRAEFEFPIPKDSAEQLFALRTGRVIEKRRHIVPQGALRWEIDVFSGELEGLIIAEIELPDETADFGRPSWLGDEVTGDSRYANARLALDGPVK